MPCLRELNLADNMLGDDGVEALAAGLVSHPCLEILILDGNDFGLDGTQGLCDSLLQNASLNTLALRRNKLLADSAEARILCVCVCVCGRVWVCISTLLYCFVWRSFVCLDCVTEWPCWCVVSRA